MPPIEEEEKVVTIQAQVSPDLSKEYKAMLKDSGIADEVIASDPQAVSEVLQFHVNYNKYVGCFTPRAGNSKLQN